MYAGQFCRETGLTFFLNALLKKYNYGRDFED